MALTVCALGGCHVGGFVVGPHKSFPGLLREHLASSHGVDVELHTFSLFRFRDTDKATHLLSEVRPDVLILQLGNFEASWVPQRSRWKRLISPRPSSGSDSTRSSEQPPAGAIDDVFRYRARHFLRHTGKRLVDLVIGRALVDFPSLESQVGAFLDVVGAHRPRAVIALTPLPSMDPVIRRLRRRLGQILTRRAAERGIAIEDSFDYVDRADCFLSDGLHLNSRGHELLARALCARFDAHREECVVSAA